MNRLACVWTIYNASESLACLFTLGGGDAGSVCAEEYKGAQRTGAHSADRARLTAKAVPEVSQKLF